MLQCATFLETTGKNLSTAFDLVFRMLEQNHWAQSYALNIHIQAPLTMFSITPAGSNDCLYTLVRFARSEKFHAER
jgi:hypothetical protein